MSPLVPFFVIVGVVLLIGVVLVEWSDANEAIRRSRDLLGMEWEQLDRARDVTGHIE